MRSALVVFAAGAVALAGVVGAALAQAPPRLVRIGAPGVKALGRTGATGVLGTFHKDATICQPYETLPAGVTGIRLSMWAFYGARIRVRAYRELGSSRWPLLTEGSHSADWTSTSVTVPVQPLRHSVAHVSVCATIGPNSEPLLLLGESTPPQVGATMTEQSAPASQVISGSAEPLNGRLAIEYLAPGRHSWWSQLLAVARHLGLGRFYSGTWIALFVAALMAVACAVSVRVALKELR